MTKNLRDSTEQAFDNLTRLNVKGPYFLAQFSQVSSRFLQEASLAEGGQSWVLVQVLLWAIARAQHKALYRPIP